MSSTPPSAPTALRNALLTDGRHVDVHLDGALVSRTVASSGRPLAVGELDLDGRLLIPAPAEPHAHLDKALTFDTIRPPQGDLRLAIGSWREYASTATVDDIAHRARAAALRMLANGTTAIRSHVDVLPGPEPMRGIEALVRVRAELAGLVDLELVVLAGPEVPDDAVDAALDAGVDLVGGAPHLAADPIADLRRLLLVARRRGVGTDLHTDEGLGGALTLAEYARLVHDWTVVTSAGHCVRLGTLEPSHLAEVVDDVVASGIGVISLPITNLYLQGWDHPVSTPRGLTALRALLDAGALVAAGADNVRDPFNPVGRCDALETASLLVTAGHLTLEESLAAVTSGAREVLGLPPAGPVAGLRADLLAIRADSLGEAIAFAPADRIVVRAGRVVATTATTTTLAAPSPLEYGVPA
ncbi:amidohydrolase family protein [Rathayibacter sp. Leaf296]|uniref:amidohydrolase family protein n=1 Tax=Rathayibacter sp. Leaf296 TaxID=1736327 RepID=UPI000703224A|nr:amidohydrolase family protein [Rathayibacter sp. Leaf296]KQQ09578.1 cytosine deaminase [Rathayibacter sp. Leaf296]